MITVMISDTAQSLTSSGQWEVRLSDLIAAYIAPINSYYLLPWDTEARLYDPGEQVTFETARSILRRLREHRQPRVEYEYDDDDDCGWPLNISPEVTKRFDDEIKRDEQRSSFECEQECERLLTAERVMCDCDSCAGHRESPEWAALVGQRIILSDACIVPNMKNQNKSLHRCDCGLSCLSCVKITDLLVSPQDLKFPVVLFITANSSKWRTTGSPPELHWFFDVKQITAFLASRPSIIDNNKAYQGVKKSQIPFRWASVSDMTDPKPALTMLHQSMLNCKTVNHTSVYFAAVFQNARFLDRPAEHELENRQAAQQLYEEAIKQRTWKR